MNVLILSISITNVFANTSEKLNRAGQSCNELCKPLETRSSITTCRGKRDVWRIEHEKLKNFILIGGNIEIWSGAN